jgi:hypothetical protein
VRRTGYARKAVPRAVRINSRVRETKKRTDATYVKADQPPLVRERKRVTSAEHLAYDEASLKLRLDESTNEICRWPVNDPEPKGLFLFCGHSVKEGKRYCEHHHHRSILPC